MKKKSKLFSDEERIKILNEAITVIQDTNDSHYKFMCCAIEKACNEKIYQDKVFEHFPELLKHQPKECFPGIKIKSPTDGWFPVFGDDKEKYQEKRVEILNKVIEEIQSSPSTRFFKFKLFYKIRKKC